MKLLKFPELLLLLAVLPAFVWQVYVGNTALDVVRPDPKSNLLFGMHVSLSLLISWLLHVFLRRYGLLPLPWRRAHVIASLCCIAVLDALAFIPHPNLDYYRVWAITLYVYGLLQWIFWIASAFLLTGKLTGK